MFGAVATVLGAFSAVAYEVTDATQTRVEFPQAPARIVTLAPSLGELAADVLEQDISRIVGVSEYTDFPPGLKSVPSVGSYVRLNLEKIAVLKPDLILATRDGNERSQIVRLREMGYRVVVVETGNFDQISASFRIVAAALGRPDKGIRMADSFQKGLTKLRRAKTSSRVLLQVGDDPLVVAGGESILSRVLEVLGFTNVYADLRQGYPRPSREDVFKRSPDTVLILALGTDRAPYERMLKRWRELDSLPAVRAGRVKIVVADALVRPTLRMLEGMALLERELTAGKSP